MKKKLNIVKFSRDDRDCYIKITRILKQPHQVEVWELHVSEDKSFDGCYIFNLVILHRGKDHRPHTYLPTAEGSIDFGMHDLESESHNFGSANFDYEFTSDAYEAAKAIIQEYCKNECVEHCRTEDSYWEFLNSDN